MGHLSLLARLSRLDLRHGGDEGWMEYKLVAQSWYGMFYWTHWSEFAMTPAKALTAEYGLSMKTRLQSNRL